MSSETVFLSKLFQENTATVINTTVCTHLEAANILKNLVTKWLTENNRYRENIFETLIDGRDLLSYESGTVVLKYQQNNAIEIYIVKTKTISGWIVNSEEKCAELLNCFYFLTSTYSYSCAFTKYKLCTLNNLYYQNQVLSLHQDEDCVLKTNTNTIVSMISELQKKENQIKQLQITVLCLEKQIRDQNIDKKNTLSTNTSCSIKTTDTFDNVVKSIAKFDLNTLKKVDQKPLW